MQRLWITVFMVMAVVLSAADVMAHNMRVENVSSGSLDTGEKTMLVTFDVTWENSWRNSVNRDAAWIFVKFRAPGEDEWEHAYLSPDSVDHQPASGSMIDAVADGVGVFIYSDAPYTGAVDYAGTRLMWKYGTNGYDFVKGDQVEISVHAIEMVYVPQGAFYVGSGGTETGSLTDGAWAENGGVGATIPLEITSEAVLQIGPESNKLWGIAGSDGATGVGEPGELPTAFPKGYAAFYCMKYSITQGQYVDFLNLLTETQAGNRVTTGVDDRHIIMGEWPDYTAELAPDRGNNKISAADVRAYADWAGLRLMTELEYEKACRGPETPEPNEYAWGNATYTSISGLTGVDGSGTEYYTAGNLIVPGSQPGGPVRVGIFARENSTREQAGASYWGIMELSGNVFERCVDVRNGRTFTGAHGNGILTATGLADVPDWPIPGMRSGSWNRGPDDARVSDRTRGALQYTARDTRFNGGRAVRTAP